jgi:sulfate transport system substrate-binding protein
VEKNAKKHGTEKLATAYLNYLYSPEAQDIAGKNFYRPRDAKALAKWSKNFPAINLVTIDKDFGGWTKAQKTHFDDGGTFDQVYGNR